MVDYIKESQSENPLPETELVQCIWSALVASVDWSIARPDQIDAMVMKETKVRELFISDIIVDLSSGLPRVLIIREFTENFRRVSALL